MVRLMSENGDIIWSVDGLNLSKTPLSRSSGGTFSSVGIKISIEIPKGIEILLFQGKKIQWGWFWSAIFKH